MDLRGREAWQNIREANGKRRGWGAGSDGTQARPTGHGGRERCSGHRLEAHHGSLLPPRHFRLLTNASVQGTAQAACRDRQWLEKTIFFSITALISHRERSFSALQNPALHCPLLSPALKRCFFFSLKKRSRSQGHTKLRVFNSSVWAVEDCPGTAGPGKSTSSGQGGQSFQVLFGLKRKIEKNLM